MTALYKVIASAAKQSRWAAAPVLSVKFTPLGVVPTRLASTMVSVSHSAWRIQSRPSAFYPQPTSSLVTYCQTLTTSILFIPSGAKRRVGIQNPLGVPWNAGFRGNDVLGRRCPGLPVRQNSVVSGRTGPPPAIVITGRALARGLGPAGCPGDPRLLSLDQGAPRGLVDGRAEPGQDERKCIDANGGRRDSRTTLNRTAVG